MAPFPTRRSSHQQGSLLPTAHYPPTTSSASSTPANSRPASPSTSRRTSPVPVAIHAASPRQAFGGVEHVGAGVSGGLGRTAESERVVRELLEDNHINRHSFTNDKGFHNHASHHLLAAYALGATPTLLKQIYELHTKTEFKPMLPLQPATINETNWLEFLGEEQYYPNYLAFFHRQISQVPVAPSPYAGRQSSVVPVVEKYLLGGQGDMLVRAVSGAIHGFINIGYGIEFGIDAIVAEGLAQSAVTSARLVDLFPSAWPPMPPRPSQFQSTLSNAFSSLRFGGGVAKKVSSSVPFLSGLPIASSVRDDFKRTAASLPRERRIPRAGLGGFTILDRILHDPYLAAGRAGRMDDFPKLDKVIEREGKRIIKWCEEWRFEGEEGGRGEWDEDGEKAERKSVYEKETFGKSPSWEECVEKCEELIWMATVIYASSSRPGYENVKLDFFLMHGLTSAIFLPSVLQAVSPHLRPYILHSHFRVMVGYWISRGRPDLYIREILMAAPACPLPPNYSSTSASAISIAISQLSSSSTDSPDAPPPSTAEEPESPKTPQAGRDGKLKDLWDAQSGSSAERELESEQGNPSRSDIAWPRMLASAVDHPDDHFAKVIRSLSFAAANFGHSPKGLYHSALPGTEIMDGSIFVRAAGLTFRSLGWAHEGEKTGAWDRSNLGYDEAWEQEPRLPGFEDKGKGRARSGTETEETYLNSQQHSADHSGPPSRARSPPILSPVPQPLPGAGWYQSSTPERVRSPEATAGPDTRVFVESGNMEQQQTRYGELRDDDDARTRAELEEDDDRELMA